MHCKLPVCYPLLAGEAKSPTTSILALTGCASSGLNNWRSGAERFIYLHNWRSRIILLYWNVIISTKYISRLTLIYIYIYTYTYDCTFHYIDNLIIKHTRACPCTDTDTLIIEIRQFFISNVNSNRILSPSVCLWFRSTEYFTCMWC